MVSLTKLSKDLYPFACKSKIVYELVSKNKFIGMYYKKNKLHVTNVNSSKNCLSGYGQSIDGGMYPIPPEEERMDDVIQTMENESDYLGNAENTAMTLDSLKADRDKENYKFQKPHFITISDIAHNLHTTSKQILSIMRNDEEIIVHNVIDDTGNIHYIKKDTNWIKVDTSKKPLILGNHKRQILITKDDYDYISDSF